MTKTIISGAKRSGRSGVPPGTRLNEVYEVERQIASGGMGEIYRGRLIETGDPVAIKMIKPEFSEDEAMMALFRKEASALHHLHHDNIVRYYIFGVDRTVNRAYLAMEFVEGVQLADMLREGPLSTQTCIDLCRNVAAGLQAAHDKGIIHRDVSPDNIIVPDGDVKRAKIIDFGIARSTKLGGATVIGDGFAGKYNYVSPEQLGMFGGDVTPRSDIYSLALLLVETLRGKPIDMGGNIADVTEKRRTVPDLAGIDPRVEPMIRKMLAPDPKDRPASMREVADQFGQPVVKKGKARASSADGDPGDGKSPIVLIAAAAVGVMALGGGAFFFMGSGKSPPVAPQERAALPTVQTAPQPDRQAAAAVDPQSPRPQRISEAEHAERIASYIRYHESDRCLFLAPVSVTNRSARIEALARSQETVQAFRTDFQLVNGFQPDITVSEIVAPQCEAIAFLHHADARADGDVAMRASKSILRPGEAIDLKLTGAGSRTVGMLLFEPDGTVRNMTSQLRRDAGTISLAMPLDEPGQGRAGIRLLVALVSSVALPQLAGTGTISPAVLNSLAEELRRRQVDIIAVPQVIRIQ